MAPILLYFVIAVSLAEAVFGQYFPPKPKGLKTVDSKIQKGARILYKEVPVQYLFYLR